MTTDGQGSLAQRLTGIDEIECVTPDLNGVPRGKVMSAAGFLEGRRLQMARGVLLQCIMGGYPPSRFYGSDDGDLALVADPKQIHRLPWSSQPRALAICDADELTGESSRLSTRGQLKTVIARYAARGLVPVVATELEFLSSPPTRIRPSHSSRRWAWMGVVKTATRRSASAPITACGRSSTRSMNAWRPWGCRAIPSCMKWA